MKFRYCVQIQWSEEDQAYLVILPEFSKDPQTHGETYEEAIKNAQEVMELLTDSYRKEGWALPKPMTYRTRAVQKNKKKRTSHAKTG